MSEFIAAIFRRKPTIRARKEMGPSERAAARTHFRSPPIAPVLSIFWSNGGGEREKDAFTQDESVFDQIAVWTTEMANLGKGLGMVHAACKRRDGRPKDIMINTHPEEVTSLHKRRPLTGHRRCGNGLSSSVEMVME